MTRINANIPPKNLTDQHLLAEHREIKRITDLFAKRLAKGSIGEIPAKFTLGTGHVAFLLDKGLFTKLRYISLLNECRKRGFIVQDYVSNWEVYLYYYPFKDYKFYRHWQATNIDNNLIKDRITERITNSTQIPRYYGKPITKQEAINLLNQ